MNGTMDSELEKKRVVVASTSSATSSPSSSTYSSSSDRLDSLLDTEEIEAAETLAQLAMRDSLSADKWCIEGAATRVTRESPTPDSDLSPSPLGPVDNVAVGHNVDTSVESEKNQQDECSEHMKVEQDADLLANKSSCSKLRRNLTEEEREARRIRRILANRESARQTIRRRQAQCEELTKKAATLVAENENLKREKELALKEYQSLETTNKHLKAQIAESIDTEVEKTPAEPESSGAEVTPLSGNGPWFLCNHFPVPQVFWPPVLQSSNPFHLQNTTFNPLAIPPNATVPCYSESESYLKQNNLTNDSRIQNPFNPVYMFPCPWLFPLPQFGNGQSSPSSSLKDKQDHLSLGKQCSSSSSLNTYQAALPIKITTEASSWTDARPINDPGYTTPGFSLDGGEKKTGCNIIEKFHGPTLGCNGHASLDNQEHGFQLHSAANNKVSSTAYTATSSLEKKQEQFICQGKSLADAVAAAEARKRRKELTKQKNIHNRQSRMQC